MIIRIQLLFLSILALSGCGRDVPISKVNVGYMSNSYSFNQETKSISYIKDSLPNKTYLTIMDANTKKSRNYHLDNYSFIGAHRIIPELNLGIVSALDIRDGIFENRILLIDLSKKKIIKSFDIPKGYTVTNIFRPRWTKNILIIYQMENEPKKAFIKTIDLSDMTESKSEVLGNFTIKGAIIHDDKPLLILDVVEENKNKLIVYDWATKVIRNAYQTMTSFSDMRLLEDEIYCLMQVSGENIGEVRRYSLDKTDEATVCEIYGVPESMLIAEKRLYIIATDPKRSNLQKKYWLCPRNLYMYDLETRGETKKIEWTQRKGIFFGFDDKANKIYFAVIDNDAPAIWFINNDIEALSKVDKIIK